MNDYYEARTRLIRTMLNSGALKLVNPDDPEGLFTLKSGRRSPFFMNLGELNTGDALDDLGEAYAEAANYYFPDGTDVFFGPAYKGIPIVVATALNYDLLGYNRYVRYCSNRKEIKDHGDGGILLGAKLYDGDRIIITEDVTTSGKSLEETIPILRAQAKVNIIGLIVAFDRMEYGHDRTKTALEEVAEKYHFKAHAIISIQDVLEYLDDRGELSSETLAKFQHYYAQYGPEGRTIC